MKILVIDPTVVNVRDLVQAKSRLEDVAILLIRKPSWGRLEHAIQLLDTDNMTTVQFEEIEPLLIKLSEGDQQ